MKVILLVPHIADGGAERIVSELSLALAVEETVVVVFQKSLDYPFKGRLISLDLPLERESYRSRLIGIVRRIRRFRRLLREERPDAVVSFMGEANFINALLSPRPILTVHNHMTSTSKQRSKIEALVFEGLLRLLYRRATVVAVSEAVKRDLVEEFGIPARQVVVIPNAVNFSEIRQKAAEPAALPWDETIPVIVTAGRLHPLKGQWHLLRAFAEVRKTMPCRLAILGTGELQEYLQRLAHELSIANDVYFLGWQRNPFKFMARADLFVLPSLSEGFGLALIEAMACGLPVIASDCPGGSREIIAPGKGAECGILVPVCDGTMYGGFDPCTPAELKLAGAILRLLQDRDLRQRYIDAGSARLQDFDREKFAESYRRVIGSAAL